MRVMVAASLSVVTPRERIATARLYLVCDARPRAFLEAALRGGADIVQLRDKTLGDDELVAAAREHETYVAGETLATEVAYEASDGTAATIEGRELRIGVLRA